MFIYFVRHGKSFANLNNLQNGNTSDPLCDEGIEQAKILKNRIQSIKIDKCYVSNWRRAQQTLEISLPDQEFEVDFRIGETNAGSVCHLKTTQFLTSYPDFYNQLDNKYPDGESNRDMLLRAEEFIGDILKKFQNNMIVVIFSHAGPITAMLQFLLGISVDKFPAFMLDNCGIALAQVLKDSTGNYSNIRLLSYNSNEVEPFLNYKIWP